jgi:hypothetical protein
VGYYAIGQQTLALAARRTGTSCDFLIMPGHEVFLAPNKQTGQQIACSKANE